MRKRYARKRGIYWLPNLITTLSLFCGFLAVMQVLEGKFEIAALLLFVSAVLDAFDGFVARATGTATRFGAEYDSLNDAVVFGAVPALSVYLWAFADIGAGQIWHRVGMLLTFFYLASTLLRLARFNSQHAGDRRFFRGLPSPAAAMMIMSLIWAWQDLGYEGERFVWLVSGAVVAVSTLMVSNFSYYSLKGVDLQGRVPFVALFAIVAGFVIAAIDFPRFVFFLSLLYVLSGPFLYLFRRWRKPASGIKNDQARWGRTR